LLSNGGIVSLFGILIGHLYFFLKFTYPQELNGADFLQTPSFIKRFYPDVRPSGVFGFANQEGRINQPQQQNPATRLFFGTGQRLGNN
jgi:Derlin-1